MPYALHPRSFRARLLRMARIIASRAALIAYLNGNNRHRAVNSATSTTARRAGRI